MSDPEETGRPHPRWYWLQPDPDDMSADAVFRRRLLGMAREVMLAQGADPETLPPATAASGPPAESEAELVPAESAARPGRAVAPPVEYFDIRPTATFLMDLAGRGVRTALGRGGSRAGRGVADLVLLAAARFPGGATTEELNRSLDLAPGTLSSTVGRLAGEGLLERRPDPQDRRRTRVRATEAGRRWAEEVAAAWRQADNRLLDGLTVAERDELRRLLRRAVSALAARRPSR